MEINCLHIADIFAQSGLDMVTETLPKLIKERDIHFVVANGENTLEGKGITEGQCQHLFNLGVHVITSGNHIWDRKKTFYAENPLIQKYLLRPLNYPVGNEGRGSTVYELKNGLKIGVINLQGRTYMYDIDCPFRVGEREIEKLQDETNIIIVDFHAEATAEKIAFRHYVDGRVSAVIGTHTHVQTADEMITSSGTAYITDAGMTGPHDGVIGMQKEPTVKKFILQTYFKFEPSKGDVRFHGLFFKVNAETGRATYVERVRIDKS
ncbi:MAG TPA: TIGR00282 family metallophosphoesterase [bacterium]|nr:TIGR00282 family metallophosphoesterase [bacterium]HMW32971.1 TIGR00282 family metallophosphoesterase [bacterium]HNB10068.1 TIGR00282 family metallophosphoesterase [bacterium]HNB58149.1 TIGR00282 family metallophosphoesterase [bacterium]HNC50155.1 TIGR00282 family metallophosphoesterase [bacterium]